MSTKALGDEPFTDNQVRRWKKQVRQKRRELFGDLRPPKIDYVAEAKAAAKESDSTDGTL